VEAEASVSRLNIRGLDDVRIFQAALSEKTIAVGGAGGARLTAHFGVGFSKKFN
jgi:hypothetical protein